MKTAAAAAAFCESVALRGDTTPPVAYGWTAPTLQDQGLLALGKTWRLSRHAQRLALRQRELSLKRFCQVLHLRPCSCYATAPLGEACACPQRRAFVESGAANAVRVTTPLRENSVWSAPQSVTNAKLKIIFR